MAILLLILSSWSILNDFCHWDDAFGGTNDDDDDVDDDYNGGDNIAADDDYGHDHDEDRDYVGMKIF